MGDISLDYFKVFEAVLSEGSVTGAAVKLGVTQPAVSNALRRLRDHYGDPLFVRTAEGMGPTAMARAIWPAIHDGLRALREASTPGFEPALTKRTFRIALSDISASLLVPSLVERLGEEAPHARLVITPKIDGNALDLLRSGLIDLAVGVGVPTAPLTSEVLREEKRMLVMGRDHAMASGPLDLPRLQSASYVAVSLSEGTEVYDDGLHAEAGLEGAVKLVVNQFSVAARVMARSELVGIFSRAVVDHTAEGAGLIARELPFDVPAVTHRLHWHRRDNVEPGHQWLRRAILEAAE